MAARAHPVRGTETPGRFIARRMPGLWPMEQNRFPHRAFTHDLPCWPIGVTFPLSALR